MRAKESLNRNLMRLSEQLLELVSLFKDGNKNFIDFSLELRRLKILKTNCAFQESTDLMV
jgi:hypothetical protein